MPVPGNSAASDFATYSSDASNRALIFFFLFLGSPSSVPTLTKDIASGESRGTKTFDGVFL